MNCRRVAQLLSNHLEDRLPARAAAEMAAHLHACQACHRLQAEMLAAGADLRALAEPLPPPDVERRAIARWLSEQTAISGGWRRWCLLASHPPARRWTLGLPAMAMALLLPVLSLALMWWERDRSIAPLAPLGVTHRPADQSAPALHSAPHSPRKYGRSQIVTARPVPSAAPGEGPVPWMPSRANGIGERPWGNPPTPPRPSHRAPAPGHLPPADPEPVPAIRRWATRPRDGGPAQWVADQIEARVRRTVPVRDDFVRIPFPRLATTSDRQIAAAVESYQRQAAVVDSRLAREVMVQQKATALADLCERLRSDTGIQLAAGPSVADEKVTLFCKKLPLREVMRQLSRPFGYTWLRSGKAGEYRYELVQDLRSQLLEEELRNRDALAALVALDREVERYRKYLDLSPDEALARAKTAPPEEKKLLEQLATTGWGGAQMYFRLSPDDMAALRAGRSLIYGSNIPPDPLRRPFFVGKRTADGLDLVLRTLPPEIARGTLQGLRDWRVRDGRPLIGRAGKRSDGIAPASSSEARAAVILKLSQNEIGQYSLIASSGLALSPESTHYILDAHEAFAVGVSPGVAQPDNRVANARLARDPALQPCVTVQAQASCGLATGAALDRIWPNPGPRVTTADILEALHRATGMSIVADYYTRLYPPADVSVRNTSVFDALNRLSDATRVRWSKESRWLRFRSAGFYHDRLKEVPNRLLQRWAASRKAHGALMLDDLIEIAQLSDAQLGSREMGEGAWRCYGLAEWPVASHPRLRHHLRFLGELSPAQRLEAQSATGLAFMRMPLARQQGFLDLAVDKDDPEKLRLEDLGGATLRVVYTLPGEFQWVRPQARDLPVGGAPSPSPVRERTREAALAAARRIDPSAEISQIVPTELDLVFLYPLNTTKSRQVAFQ